MSEANKARLRRFYDEVFNKGNLAVMDEMAVANFVDHNPSPGQLPGLEGVKQMFAAMRTALPDMRVTVEDMVAEGDKVAAHVTLRATHGGEFMGIAPTGRGITARIADIVRFADGKAVERWGVEDMSDLLQALGVSSPPQ
ncbi:MAG: hypothetical protein A3I61_02430 [Acidobacteria bacterium RIFCSPLOWO2_02_FULL_68_18]|nr:MAG: hypothetical protein A3I61_02430 [Acidobacteria bacterium RIFCSPLOWO2_02_FULL_68_18]OFW51691.1 MAG: hypothetical protein A3G77_12465 [Acidobacteria bacterium RIFCSPLOWO2_12_FULL_68_19]